MISLVPPRVLLTEDLRDHLRAIGADKQALVRSFQQWKALAAQGKEHFEFGRDVPGLGNRHLRHVHMVPLYSPADEARWRRNWRYGRERKSDRYLLYADGTPAFGYLLITLINDPGAHTLWEPQNRQLVQLLERIADDFHHHGRAPDESAAP